MWRHHVNFAIPFHSGAWIKSCFLGLSDCWLTHRFLQQFCNNKVNWNWSSVMQLQEEVEYDDEAEYEAEEAEPSSEAPPSSTEGKKLVGAGVRPFRSNTDLLETLKKRRQQAVEGNTKNSTTIFRQHWTHRLFPHGHTTMLTTKIHIPSWSYLTKKQPTNLLGFPVPPWVEHPALNKYLNMFILPHRSLKWNPYRFLQWKDWLTGTSHHEWI